MDGMTDTNPALAEKLIALDAVIGYYSSALVAFSGGVTAPCWRMWRDGSCRPKTCCS